MRIFTFFFLILSFSAKSQTPIIIDGNFDDWNTRQPIHSDPSGDASLDFGQLWAESDEQFLFLRIALNFDIELTEDNTLELYIDTDNNPSTGSSIADMGADLSYDFGNRSGRLWSNGNFSFIFHNDIGFFSAPTVTSDRFEIAIRRDDAFYNENIFSSDKIKIYLRDNRSGGDKLPDNGSIEYELNDGDIGTLPEWSFEKKDIKHLRILSYNVERDALFDNSKQQSFKRIIQATEPDILAFQEIYDNNSRQVADLIDQWLPLGSGKDWYHAEVQPDIKIVSRFPILKEQQLQGGGSSSSGNGAFLIDLSAEYSDDLLLINAHLPCCDNDFNRQAEIDQIMGFIRDSKAGTSSVPLPDKTPIVIVGDMNTVGEKQQIETFVRGNIINESVNGPDFEPDWDFTDFDDALPPTTNYPAAFTWFNESSSFSPGRLDLVFYTGSVLELKNSFALFTRAVPSNLLQSKGLFSEDAIAASDHLPVIADFKLKNTVNVNDREKADFQFQINPNPFIDNLTGSFQLKNAGLVNISAYDLTGQKIKNLLNENLTSGIHSFNFSGSDIAPGMYFLKLETATKFAVYKIIKK